MAAPEAHDLDQRVLSGDLEAGLPSPLKAHIGPSIDLPLPVRGELLNSQAQLAAQLIFEVLGATT